MAIAVIAITRHGVNLGKILCDNISAADFYVSSRYVLQADTNCHTFEPSDLKKLTDSLWRKYVGFVFIMATGIVVRMIAPLLESKETDPAVVVMDEAGKFAVSLLSGHLGGANQLAERCEKFTGAKAVITTATDANNLPSFDMLAKEQEWGIDDITQVKHLNSLLLDNEEIAIVGGKSIVTAWMGGRANAQYFDSFDVALRSSARGFLFVTNRNLSYINESRPLLILRPRNIVVGIGCNRGTLADEIEELVLMHFQQLSLSVKSIRCIASVAAKSNETGLMEFARRLGVPFKCYKSEDLNKVSFPSPPSEHAMLAVGVAAVAEPAALLASNGGCLLLNKVKSVNVTLAVAECKEV
jgi:cobalt-precorrin 5A hydrolase